MKMSARKAKQARKARVEKALAFAQGSWAGMMEFGQGASYLAAHAAWCVFVRAYYDEVGAIEALPS